MPQGAGGRSSGAGPAWRAWSSRSTAASRPANGTSGGDLDPPPAHQHPDRAEPRARVPVAAAGHAEVRAGDPDPLEVLRARRASARPARGCASSTRPRSTSACRASATRSARSSRTASSSPRSSTRGARRRRLDPVRHLGVAEGLGEERRPARPRGGRSGGAAAAAPRARRPRRSSPEAVCSSRAASRKCSQRRLQSRRGHPQRLLDGDLRHPLDLDRGDRDAAAVRSDREALGGRAEEQADRPRSSAIDQRPLRHLARLPGQRLPGRRVADAERALEPLGVEGAQRDPGLDDRDRRARRPAGRGCGSRRRGAGRGSAARPGCGCGRGRARSGGRRRGRPRGSAVRAGGSPASRRCGRRGRAGAGGTGSGLLPGLASTSTQAIPRPGNSEAMWGATQPCRGAGTQPIR